MSTTGTAGSAVVIEDVPSIELADWGPLAEGTGDPMATWGKELWKGEDGRAMGIWKCAPGPSRWLFSTNEVIHVVSGCMTVSEDGGEPFVIKAGDDAVFPKGWSGTWDIHDTILKVYTEF